MLNANFSVAADKTIQKARCLFLRILCSTEETAAYAQKPEQFFSRRDITQSLFSRLFMYKLISMPLSIKRQATIVNTVSLENHD
jgi:hypothetical protein